MKIEVNYNQLYSDLNNLKRQAPCGEGPCVGYQCCEYGVNGCYGAMCAIEIVQQGIAYYSQKEVT